MSEAAPRRESPLAGRSLPWQRNGVVMREHALLGHINLRGNPTAREFIDRVAGALGVALPIVANTTAQSAERVVYWLGPDEWLVVCPGDAEAPLAADLARALAGQFASVVELSGGQTALRIAGGGVRDLLARGCPLDLHPRRFTLGQCAQTHVAKAPVLLRPLADGMEIIVRRSFADYLWQWVDTVSR